MVGLYHCTWRRARLRIQAGRDIQRHHRRRVVVRLVDESAATGSRGALRRPVPSRPSIISEISSGHGMVAAWITPPALSHASRAAPAPLPAAGCHSPPPAASPAAPRPVYPDAQRHIRRRRCCHVSAEDQPVRAGGISTAGPAGTPPRPRAA